MSFRTNAERRAELAQWFSGEAPTPVIDGETFDGVAVYEIVEPHRTGVRAQNRIGLAWPTDYPPRSLLPCSCQPSDRWSKARLVGLARTLEDALEMLGLKDTSC